jgi:tetratricopeptide (TPR) repeat protein
MKFRNIVFFGNCQASALASLYRDAFGAIDETTVTYMSSYEETAGAKQALAQADALVVQEFDFPSPIKLSDIGVGAKRIAFPSAVAGFLWPFGSKTHPRNEPRPFLQTGPYPAQMGDGFLNRLMADNVPTDDAVQQYLELDVVKRANLDRLHELFMDRQKQRDSRTGFDLASVIESQFRDEPLFLTPDHPTMRIFREVTLGVFDFLGVASTDTEVALDHLRFAPFPREGLPIHPAVARHFGMSWANENTRYHFLSEGKFTFEEYIRRYYEYDWNSDLQEGLWLSAQSDHALALEKLDAGLTRSPNSLTGLCARSAVLMRLGRQNEAMISAHRAAELWPDEPEGHYAVADRLREQGDLVAAEASARRAVGACPIDVSARRVLGVVLAEMGRTQEAVEMTKSAIALRPGDANSHLTLGHQFVREHKTDEAIAAFRTAGKIEPDNERFLIPLVDCLIAASRLSEATAEIKRFLEHRPRTGAVQARLASVLLRQSDLQGAQTAMEQVIYLEPNSVAHRRLLADILTRRGRLADAGEVLAAAVALAPADAHLAAAVGDNLARRGNLAPAEAAFARASMLAPGNAAIRRAHADVVGLLGRGPEAIALARLAVDLEPNRAENHSYLGHQLSRNGQLDEAERSLRRAMELDPEHMDSYRILADVFARKGQRPEAIGVLRSLLKKRPNDARAQAILADLLVAATRAASAEAETALRRALELDPGQINARLSLIELLAPKQDRRGARALVRAGLERDPNHEKLKALAESFEADAASVQSVTAGAVAA